MALICIDDRREEILAVEELKSAKPCPFCNKKPVYFLEKITHFDVPLSEDDDHVPRDDGRGKLYSCAVFCLSCDAYGLLKGSRNQAITYWNRRF
jgi:Lar family restriction alleviation protein